MLQEASEKLLARERHRAPCARRGVLIPEGHGRRVNPHDAGIRDRGAMRIAREIAQHAIGALYGGLRIHDPRRLPHRGGDDHRRQEPCAAQEEPRAKADRQRTHGDEVLAARASPCAVRGERATRHETMDVRMIRQRARPRVQHRQQTDRAAEIVWIGGKRLQRLRRGLHQRAQQHALMRPHDRAERVGQREHHMEVRHGEQLRLPGGEPRPRTHPVTRRTTPMAARVIDIVLVAARITLRHVSAHRRRATRRQIVEGTPASRTALRQIHAPAAAPPAHRRGR